MSHRRHPAAANDDDTTTTSVVSSNHILAQLQPLLRRRGRRARARARQSPAKVVSMFARSSVGRLDGADAVESNAYETFAPPILTIFSAPSAAAAALCAARRSRSLQFSSGEGCALDCACVLTDTSLSSRWSLSRYSFSSPKTL